MGPTISDFSRDSHLQILVLAAVLLAIGGLSFVAWDIVARLVRFSSTPPRTTRRRKIALVLSLLWVCACSGAGASHSSRVKRTRSQPSHTFMIAPFSTPAGTYDALGDSITAQYPAPYNQIVPYPILANLQLGAPYSVHDLAVSGSRVRYINDWNATTCSGSTPDVNVFLETQIEKVDADAIGITVETGTNEMLGRAADVVKGCSTRTPQQDADAMMVQYTADLALLRARAPKAQIIILNNANVAYLGTLEANGHTAGYNILHPASTFNATPWIVAGIRAINALSKSHPNLTIVDTACDAKLYDPHNFTTGLTIHPNQLGQAEIARLLISTLNTPNLTPKSDCSWMH